MAERAPPPADPPGPQFMAEKLARLDADLHRLLDAAAPMREDCAARDPRAPAERLHRALPDCRVTLASYVEARKRKWW